jgi:uncharacterized protein YcaQ
MLDTIRHLGFLQIDPISTVAPPQKLVLWSRLGPHDAAELDRLLWSERKLVEWRAFIWPIEQLPLLRARMRARKAGRLASGRRGDEFLKENASFRRYVLRELERRGPLLGRDLENRSQREREPHPWWGTRDVGIMLELLQARGEIAIVGRQGNQRLWDLAERWYPPEAERVPLEEAERMRTGRRRTSRSATASRCSHRSTG